MELQSGIKRQTDAEYKSFRQSLADKKVKNSIWQIFTLQHKVRRSGDLSVWKRPPESANFAVIQVHRWKSRPKFND